VAGRGTRATNGTRLQGCTGFHHVPCCRNRRECTKVLAIGWMGHLIVEFAAQRRLPAMYATREFVNIGGLISYGVDFHDLFRRAAGYVDRILRGAKPADLPVEQPTKFTLVINLKTAKALGLDVPDKMLALADEVIE
jgi:ABC-type uncharacterized transport system substrate-binding protein